MDLNSKNPSSLILSLNLELDRQKTNKIGANLQTKISMVAEQIMERRRKAREDKRIGLKG